MRCHTTLLESYYCYRLLVSGYSLDTEFNRTFCDVITVSQVTRPQKARKNRSRPKPRTKVFVLPFFSCKLRKNTMSWELQARKTWISDIIRYNWNTFYINVVFEHWNRFLQWFKIIAKAAFQWFLFSQNEPKGDYRLLSQLIGSLTGSHLFRIQH